MSSSARSKPGRRVSAALRRGGLALALLATLVTTTAPVPAATGGPDSYVALGDSYTAGPGIPHQQLDPPGCQRSDHNYPHLLAAAAAIPVLRDVSCSGAETMDMTAPQPAAGGPNPAQLDSLEAGTDLVTIGVGGNDIGFGEIVASCFTVVPLGHPCQSRYASGGDDQISRRIAETAPKVGAVLAAIHDRSPRARLLVVGYPAILPDNGIGCWPVLPVAPADVAYLRAKHRELNAMLAEQAAAGGAAFVDVYGPSVGHDACALPHQRWVEPLVPTSPAAPVHPNAAGMAGMARAVQATL
ncbi:MAG: SGNH/GDSL hydrolase family protein [Actinomycetota bacterium]|nr:SGNH/GDSL hydrolase family protein [Actinomycetota bacterium]